MGWDPGQLPCDPWFLSVFRECLRTTRDYIGFASSMTSILLWFVAQMPQLVRNYKTKTVEALSPWFLAQWLLGDTGNILGCLLTGDQNPTTTYTAMYFVLADIVLMMQYIYYGSLSRRRERIFGYSAAAKRHHRHHHRRRDPSGAASTPAEAAAAAGEAAAATPNVGCGVGGGGGGSSSSGAYAHPADRQQRTHHKRHKRDPEQAFAGAGGEPLGPPPVRGYLTPTPVKAAGLLACVATLGLAAARGTELGGMAMAVGGQQEGSAVGRALAENLQSRRPQWVKNAGQVCGYASTLLYLSSRMPQIYLNFQRRSVEGLAMMMFLCAVGANAAYGFGILIRATSWQAVVRQAPWILGSLGTTALDAFILSQFVLYRKKGPPLPPPPTSSSAAAAAALGPEQEPLLRSVRTSGGT